MFAAFERLNTTYTFWKHLKPIHIIPKEKRLKKCSRNVIIRLHLRFVKVTRRLYKGFGNVVERFSATLNENVLKTLGKLSWKTLLNVKSKRFHNQNKTLRQRLYNAVLLAGDALSDRATHKKF